MANSNSNLFQARVIPNSTIGYQQIYGVGILDDIHNYFPEFMYNQSRFQRPDDIFNYLNHGLRLFRGFPDAQELYFRQRYETPLVCPHCNHDIIYENNHNTGIPRRRGISTRTINTVTNTSINSVRPTPAAATAATTEAAFAPLPTRATTSSSRSNGTQNLQPRSGGRIPTITTTQFFEHPLDENSLISSLLDLNNPLLSIFSEFTNIPLNVRNINNLEPVVVRPNAEQIANATDTHIISAIDNSTCTICLSGFQVGDEVRVINHCNHTYHKSCIDRHFEGSVRCPLCRFDIREPSGHQTETNERVSID
jgi:hypothetical protein